MPYGRLESFPAKDTIGFHQKFWNDFRSQEGFEWWGSAMLELRKMMLTMGEPASKYVVPGIPKRYDEWCTVRDSNSMFDKTLLLSVGDEKAETISQAHMFQATHTNFQQQVKKYKLLEALQFAGNQLESTYDWVWLLFPGADFTKNDKPLAAQLGRFKSLTSPLIVFNDCGSLRSGSLLIRKAAAKYLLQYVQDVFDRNVKGNTASALELADDSVWAGLAEVFSYPSVVPGFDVSWRAENNTGYYEYNKQCTYFYPIEAFKV
ncbi:hypothetical protein BDR26DRAFT_860335 [Obelidium mucronatum]|nr:hypothetical protein BDR26DRAFT_860335 [Obelidium mucronatum]